MSEEEIKDVLEEFIKTGYHTLMFKYNGDRRKTNYKIEQAIQGLLDLYNKQKEEIKSLNNQLDFIGEQNKYIDRLKNIIANKNKEIKLMKSVNINEEIERDFISKDKIRDKIKELEWYGEYIKYRFVYTDYDKEVNKVKIETLKELLEEE